MQYDVCWPSHVMHNQQKLFISYFKGTIPCTNKKWTKPQEEQLSHSRDLPWHAQYDVSYGYGNFVHILTNQTLQSNVEPMSKTSIAMQSRYATVYEW